ncbi:exodeoxyribonuclease VII large subunit [Azospirillum sp. sgz302134]
MTQDFDASPLIAAPLIAAEPRPGSNLPEYSVGDLARRLKRTIEEEFGFVRVRGEISQPKKHSSGHCYLRLKDDTAVIEAVCWRGTVAKLAVKPEEGLEVIVTGRMTTYPGRSQYQLVIESMELAGEGALLKMLEERKRRLAAEGLFDPDRKKPIPFLPDVIGVITSPTGAVIRDILHRLNDRFPRRVLLWPVAVQGERAAAEVTAAIEGFNRIAPGGPVPRPDLLIVARGGGSLEDLMAFNEESVVRAAAASRIPLISAVGHETDTTLIDYASDRRAPTPTAAAEMAVPVRAELLAGVLDAQRRLLGCANRILSEHRTRVEGLGRGLGDPRALLEGHAQRLDDRAERLVLAAGSLLERRRTRVGELGAKLRHPREKLMQASQRLASEGRALDGALRHAVMAARGQYERVGSRLSLGPIKVKAGDGSRRLEDLKPRLERSYGKAVEERTAKLAAVGQLLESYSYKGVLARGFALVEAVGDDGGGKPLTSAAQATPGLSVSLVFADGKAAATVDGAPKAEAAPVVVAPVVAAPEPPMPKPKAEKPKPEPRKPHRAPVQGSLF